MKKPTKKRVVKKLAKKTNLKSRIALICAIVGFAILGTYFIARSSAATAETTVFKTTANYCYRIPSIVRDSDGRLYAFAERRKAGCDDNGDFDISMKTKALGGNWSAERIIVQKSTNRASNPVPIIKNNVVYLIHSLKDNSINKTVGMYQKISRDRGKTWSNETLVMQTNTLSGPGHGLALSNGRMLFATGHGGLYSDNNGKTWNWGYKLSEAEKGIYIEGSIAYLGSNRLLVCYKTKEEVKRSHRCTLSKDGGLSIGKLEAERFNTPLTVSVYGNLLKPTGYNYAFYSMPTDPTYRKGMGIYASKITNDTTSIKWSIGKPYIVKQKSTRSAYSDMVQVGPKIGMLYETGVDATYERIVYTEIPIKTVINTAY